MKLKFIFVHQNKLNIHKHKKITIMGSTSEVGHAKNVANFQDLADFLEGFGATYNPAKTALKLPQVKTQIAKAEAALDNVTDTKTAFNDATNERVIVFSDLKSLSTRLMGALRATDASKQKIDDAEGFNKKIQGVRTSKTPKVATPDTPVPDTISTAQLSYDQQIQHFTGLISVLQSEPTYKPNEADLKLTALNAKKADMIKKNKAVNLAFTKVSNARILRNKLLYAVGTGILDTAEAIKLYVRSVFGTTSAEYKQVKGIPFKLVK